MKPILILLLVIFLAFCAYICVKASLTILGILFLWGGLYAFNRFLKNL